MSETRKEISAYLENASLFFLGVLFFAFPLVFTSQSTDPFGLPKQLLLGGVGLLTLLLLAGRMINEGQVHIRKSPFDLPVFLFGLVALLSAVFSTNMIDSLTAVAPLLFGVFAYFAVVSAARRENGVLFLLGALILGAVVVSVLALLSFFNLYVLPFSYAHSRVFSPMGSLLDQAIYLAGILPITGYFAYATLAPMLNRDRKANLDAKAVAFGVATLIVAVGLVVSILDMVTLQNPTILPLATGFQTAFAAISQDAQHVIKSFLLGSGYGTFMTDFTRYKTAAYNANPALWSFTFFRSTTYALELLATTGIVGVLSFIFLIYKVSKERPRKKEGFLGVFLAVGVMFVLSFLLPYSFVEVTLIFILLGLFAAIQGLVHPNRVYDISLVLVAMRKNIGLFQGQKEERSNMILLPIVLFIVIALIAGFVGYLGFKYALSDLTFEKSLVAESQNNGLATYQLQQQAIGQFPYREAYLRIFSQTNMALANSLAGSQPRGSSPSAQTQQYIVQLAQQSITAGRSAVNLSPLNTLDWQNLSSIYRALIGFGAQAENYAIAANQQAIALDGTNPQEYINLGGIYYQLGQWDNAILAFQQAVNLKPDYPNAHYNLGHAYESKGDNQDALAQYQVVAQLVANDKTNSAKIQSEINALQAKISGANAQNTQNPTNGQNGQLQVSQPQAQLPERKPPVQIQGPEVSVTPIPSPTGATSPTPAK